ncbi:carbohydrate-binding family 9-like protein [Dysgonomonas sp. ZJ709]|uniref:carbohydrate-binding family 9-like protein n=1 Tax=Dysgonomonas sp. ZJ709 TaxID=2709797 RepID=UPI0013EC7E2C|nr:carbohydrate-binding family 9-like protein [Dysgonomonas sp. ZJ709]
MLVPKIRITETNNASLITEALDAVSLNAIGSVNWESQYPYKPDVSFKIAHNGDYLFLQYFVEENEILAKTTKDNGPVWTDSCVEFFISFGESPYYYNAEFSCIGKALFGYRKDRKDSVYGDFDTMSSIKRYPSLGTDNFERKEGNFKWNLLLVMPTSVFWKDDIKSFNGVKARANLYKCGDDLSKPHFLSWNPINNENPNFHLPNFFGFLDFED